MCDQCMRDQCYMHIDILFLCNKCCLLSRQLFTRTVGASPSYHLLNPQIRLEKTYMMFFPELLGQRSAQDLAANVGRSREVSLAALTTGRADVCERHDEWVR